MEGVNPQPRASSSATPIAAGHSFQRIARLTAAAAALIAAPIGGIGDEMARILALTAAGTALLAWRCPHRRDAAAVTDLALATWVGLCLSHPAVSWLPVLAGAWHAPALGRWRAATLTGTAVLSIVLAGTDWYRDGVMGLVSAATAAAVAAIAARRLTTSQPAPDGRPSAGTPIAPFVNALGARAVAALDHQSPAHADIVHLRRIVDAQLGVATAQARGSDPHEHCMERVYPAMRLESACQAYAAMAREKGIVLQCLAEPEIPERALIDASALDAATGWLIAAAIESYPGGGELLVHAGVEDHAGQGAARLVLRPLIYPQQGAATPLPAKRHDWSRQWRPLEPPLGVASLGDMPADGIALNCEPLGPCSARRHLDPALMSLQALILGRGAIATAAEAYMTALGLRVTVQQGPEGLAQDHAPEIVIIAPGARASRQCEHWCGRVRERFPDAVSWCQAVPEAGVREGIDVHGLLRPPVTRSTLRALAHSARPLQSRQPTAPSPQHPQVPAHRSNGERVLLAEDDAISARVVERFLERVGCDVTVRGDGDGALAALHNGGFDLALVDMHLPGIDGVTLTRRWREHEAQGTRLPMIALTGRGAETDRLRCREAGMDAFLQKPVSADALYTMLSEFLPWSQRSSA